MAKILSSGRYIMLAPIVGAFLGFVALITYEVVVLVAAIASAIEVASISTKAVKVFAVGVVEAVDVFLIAIAVYIISVGLYVLFVDDLPDLPKWMDVKNLDDLKSNLISVVIAVLAVLFLREAVAWDGRREIAAFGISVAFVVSALTFFLIKAINARK